ncbi:MAG: hypothetical protein IKW74_07645, partial [Thermoguttaceae bacterium]|nr:hypothetical protein [Thermoguttaceae bacterium]
MDKKKRSPLHSDHSVPDSQQAQPTGASNHPSPNSGQSAGLRNEIPSNEKDSFDDKNLSFRQSSDSTAEKISPDVTCEYPDGLRVRSRPAFRTLSR